MIARLCVLLLLVAASDIAHAQLTDSDLRCYSEQSCRALVGKRVWVKYTAVPLCPTTDPLKNCANAPVNSSLMINGVVRDGRDGFSWIFQVTADNGKKGYVSESNAHLLTFKNPGPALEAQKRRAQQEAEQKRKQAEADAKEITETPPEVYEKACILAAAERLPRIPGIEIVTSRAKPLPDDLEQKKTADIFFRLIEIDAKAAGQSVTYTFMCAKGVRTPAFIQGVAAR